MNATETPSSLSDVIFTSMTSLNSSLVSDNQTGSVEPQEEDPYAYYYSDIFWEKVSFIINLVKLV